MPEGDAPKGEGAVPKADGETPKGEGAAPKTDGPPDPKEAHAACELEVTRKYATREGKTSSLVDHVV